VGFLGSRLGIRILGDGRESREEKGSAESRALVSVEGGHGTVKPSLAVHIRYSVKGSEMRGR
jgi:hypothetical protein